jgi:hypothetical protein
MRKRASSNTSRVVRTLAGTVVGLVTILASCPPAVAQEPAAGTRTSRPVQGTITPIESGFVIAPDVRLTQVNDRSATLAGVYGGWMTERTILIGAGGYWLANDARDLDMMYFGPVVEWLVRGDRKFAFGARSLVGGGWARIGGTLGELFDVSDAAAISGGRGGRSIAGRSDRRLTRTSQVIVEDDFFIFEPQAVVSLRATRWLHVDVGAGYRVIAGTGELNDRLQGVSGTISVQFGGR